MRSSRRAATVAPAHVRLYTACGHPNIHSAEQAARLLYTTTRNEAIRRRIPSDDAEDAAMGAVMRCLCTVQPSSGESVSPSGRNWNHTPALSELEIHRRARVEARNCARARLRETVRSVSLTTLEAAEHCVSDSCIDERAEPCSAVQHRCFVAEVVAAVQSLPSSMSNLVWEHHIEQKSLYALAVQRGCSTEAIRKRLARALRQVRKALRGHGWT